MNRKELERIINTDFPDIEITKKTKELAQYPRIPISGNVRLSTGRFYTSKEYKKHRYKVLNTPLP